jgi:hypothetical protein
VFTGLRGKAREQNLYQNMWLQYNQAKKMQEGTWCSVWEDYKVSKGALVKTQVPFSHSLSLSLSILVYSHFGLTLSLSPSFYLPLSLSVTFNSFSISRRFSPL